MRIQYTTFLPNDVDLNLSSTGFIDLPFLLPLVVQRIVTSDKRSWDIFIKRRGLNGHRTYTLVELGAAWQISRERIRQIESQSYKNLESFLNQGELDGRPERLHPLFTAEINRMIRFLKESGFPSSDNQIWSALSERYKTQICYDTRAYFEVLLGLYGITSCEFASSDDSPNVKFWVCSQEQELQCLKGLEATMRVLCNKSGSESLFDLLIAVNLELKKNGLNFLNKDDVARLLSWNSMIELSDDRYRLSFYHLSSNELRAERVLSDYTKDGLIFMTTAEITREINSFHAKTGKGITVTPAVVSQACTTSPAIVRIGGTGEWALKQTVDQEQVEVRDIHLLMEEALRLLNKPATSNEIHVEVSRKREVKLETVRSLLEQHPNKFVRIDRGVWSLRDWNLKQTVVQRVERVERATLEPVRGKRGDVQRIARRILKQDPQKQMPALSLVVEIESETHYARGLIYNSISHMPDVERLGGRIDVSYRIIERFSDED